METILEYFKSWTSIRYVRLGLGLAFLYEMLTRKIWVLGIAALFLLLQAFFNFGCGTSHCNIRYKNK